MSVRKDIEGQRFGRLTVVAPTRIGKRLAWIVLCDCGTSKAVVADSLLRGQTESCGCLRRELASKRAALRNFRHGLHKDPLRVVWMGMHQRCTNPEHIGFIHYGARGVRVCERWQSLENFVADMGARPPGTTIERMDANGDYSPDNCCWATVTQQNRNKRDTVRITFDGVTQCAAEWARDLGMEPSTLRQRIKAGWDPVVALTQPVRQQRNSYGT